MGIIAISIGGLLLIVWVFRLMSRADRANRQRVQRRREIWEAEGGTGPEPSDYIGRG
jgi:type II secretory pathway component PulJ